MAYTAAEQLTYTIRFEHHAVLMPSFTSADRIVAVMKHLTDAIWQQPPTAPPEELAAFHRLWAVILG